MTVALWLLLAFVASLGLVPVCRAVALRLNLVSVPREDRWNKRPVAMFGGVAVAIVVFGGAAIGGLVPHIPLLLGAAALTFGVGLTDDIVRLKPATKLIAQIAVASLFLAGGYRLNWVGGLTVDTLLTVVWLVGITNAFNLLDNMDGLCGGIALIAGLSLLLDLLPSTAPNTTAFFDARFLALLLGGVAGFLVYNFHPASVFLGDSGSLLIGLSFGALTLSAPHQASGRSDVLSIVAAPVVTLLIPIADTALVTVSRWLSGRAASEGGRDHSSHRLVAMGLSERVAVVVLWAIAAIGGCIALVVRYYAQTWSIPLAIGFVLFLTIFAVYLGRIRVYSEGDVRVPRGRAFTPIVVEMMHKRRVAEVLLDFCLIALAYYAAYRLKFEAEAFLYNFTTFYRSLPLVVSVQLIAFFVVGVYRGVWRYFGLMDAVVVAQGVALGAVSTIVALLFATRFFSYSRTVFAIYTILLLLLMILSRASFRLIGEFLHRQRDGSQRLIIYGGGSDGAIALSEVRQGNNAYRILGFVDDDREQLRTRIHGYPVLGGYDYLIAQLERHTVDAVVISCRTVQPEQLQRIERLCADASIALFRLKVDLRPVLGDSERRGRVAVLHPKRSSSDIAR
jgi:UDP-GlcNAc:undecaprenyl-phosphate/decaprenyl-phosphate GlcNAc-1-phosphate transferase